MWLKRIIELGKAIFISSYTNFNIITSLHIARYLATLTPTVYFVHEVDLPPTALNILDHDVTKSIHVARSLNDIDLIQSKPILVAIIDVVNTNVFNVVVNKTRDFYIFTQKFPRSKRRRDYHIYRVWKVKEDLFLVYTDNNQKYLFKIFGGSFKEMSIPNEIMRLCDELRELMAAFGAIKASNFVKYCSRKYGYSKETCLELLRQAILLRLIKYVNGYLFPVS
ncbi:MAG: hypothetical protein QXL96_00300 [Ignisphaera sp.]